MSKPLSACPKKYPFTNCSNRCGRVIWELSSLIEVNSHRNITVQCIYNCSYMYCQIACKELCSNKKKPDSNYLQEGFHGKLIIH